MKLIDLNKVDLENIDCHLHSAFSHDARRRGAGAPEDIVAAIRAKGLKGFIVTDHFDAGHWKNETPIDFDEYFAVWNDIRKKNPDLSIYIGLEVGFEPATQQTTAKLLDSFPFEYVINSTHYWVEPDETGRYDHFAEEKIAAYTAYLKAVSKSLDAVFDYSVIGHLGYPVRRAPYDDRAMYYEMFKDLFDEIAEKAVKRGVRFEENTNGNGKICLPRLDFLAAYKQKGGVRPPLGSDAHLPREVGRFFTETDKALDKIFGA